jgi:hypothetical protein
VVNNVYIPSYTKTNKDSMKINKIKQLNPFIIEKPSIVLFKPSNTLIELTKSILTKTTNNKTKKQLIILIKKPIIKRKTTNNVNEKQPINEP